VREARVWRERLALSTQPRNLQHMQTTPPAVRTSVLRHLLSEGEP
jgi:hypothetical protein